MTKETRLISCSRRSWQIRENGAKKATIRFDCWKLTGGLTTFVTLFNVVTKRSSRDSWVPTSFISLADSDTFSLLAVDRSFSYFLFLPCLSFGKNGNLWHQLKVCLTLHILLILVSHRAVVSLNVWNARRKTVSLSSPVADEMKQSW